ncbi:MAG: hypothetical protein ABIH23_16790 [bacterium]
MKDLAGKERDELNAEYAAYFEQFKAWLEHPFTKLVMEDALEKAAMAGYLCRTIRICNEDTRTRVIENQIRCTFMEGVGDGSYFQGVYTHGRELIERRARVRFEVARTQDQALEGSGVRDGDPRGRSELD